MKFSHLQIKIITILFSAAVLLLIFDFIIIKLKKNSVLGTTIGNEVSGFELDKQLHITLNNFDFEPGWIKEKKSINIDKDSLYKSYKIFVPKDLTIPELLVDLFSDYNKNNVKLVCKEIKIGGETEINIYSGNFLKLNATINYGTAGRNKVAAGFLLNDFELKDSEDSLLFGIPEPFCAIISPSSSSVNWVDFITNKNKEYAVLLDDNIPELKFKLSAAYSKNRILGSLRSIIGNYSDAIIFLIDVNSDLYNSVNGKFILSELNKRKIKYINSDMLIDLDKSVGNNLQEKFNSLITSEPNNSYINLVVPANDFSELITDISVQRKRGVKFLNVSEILSRRNQQNLIMK